MLRLGHIDFSNCVPIHSLLLEGANSAVEIVHGIPSELNRALADGAIDVAPCSSIEYARNAGRYRLLRDVVIGSYGPVRSILLESRLDPGQLDGHVVAIPTASATSVVLLKILLRHVWRVEPHFVWFDQRSHADPLAGDAKAVLRIGDVALLHEPRPGTHVYDLGTVWTEWTGLPFAFAVWQTNVQRDRDDELHRLLEILVQSRVQALADPVSLATRYATRFGMTPAAIADYWTTLRYELDESMLKGLERFYRLAAEIGEAPAGVRLHWV